MSNNFLSREFAWIDDEGTGMKLPACQRVGTSSVEHWIQLSVGKSLTELDKTFLLCLQHSTTAYSGPALRRVVTDGRRWSSISWAERVGR